MTSSINIHKPNDIYIFIYTKCPKILGLMETKMKCWLFLLAILLFFESRAQMQSHVMVICTHHRNELAARGFTNIFERDGKYCVAIADSSMEVLNDISEWIRSGLMFILKPSEEENVEEWIVRREQEKKHGLLDEFINWSTGENYGVNKASLHGQAPTKVAAKNKEEQWLDSMFNFWNVD